MEWTEIQNVERKEIYITKYIIYFTYSPNLPVGINVNTRGRWMTGEGQSEKKKDMDKKPF